MMRFGDEDCRFRSSPGNLNQEELSAYLCQLDQQCNDKLCVETIQRENISFFLKEEKNNKAMKMLQMLSSIKFMLIHVCQCFVVCKNSYAYW